MNLVGAFADYNPSMPSEVAQSLERLGLLLAR
jgi:hypothetical protein